MSYSGYESAQIKRGVVRETGQRSSAAVMAVARRNYSGRKVKCFHRGLVASSPKRIPCSKQCLFVSASF
jgi:hypothetical protein